VVSALISAKLCNFGYNLQCRKMLSLDTIKIVFEITSDIYAIGCNTKESNVFEMYVLCSYLVRFSLEDSKVSTIEITFKIISMM
jgi:glycine cleavage system regulatory protein